MFCDEAEVPKLSVIQKEAYEYRNLLLEPHLLYSSNLPVLLNVKGLMQAGFSGISRFEKNACLFYLRDC